MPTNMFVQEAVVFRLDMMSMNWRMPLLCTIYKIV
jgi:hypothetical protein